MNRLLESEDWIHRRIRDIVGFKQNQQMIRKVQQYGHRETGEWFEGENGFRNTFQQLLGQTSTSTKGLADLNAYPDDLIGYLTDTILGTRDIKFRHFRGPSAPFTYHLFGPSAEDKAFFVEVLAHELKLKVLRLSASDILDEFAGVAATKIKIAFKLAKESAPCLLFFDEMDVLFPDRGDSAFKYGVPTVAQFKADWDDLEDFNRMNPDKEVILIGSTTIPTILDMCLRSRISRSFYVPLPTRAERKEFLSITLGFKVTRILEDADWNQILIQTDAYSYADLTNLCHDIIRMVQKLPAITPSHIFLCAGRRSPVFEDKRVAELCEEFSKHCPRPAKYNWDLEQDIMEQKRLLKAKTRKMGESEVQRHEVQRREIQRHEVQRREPTWWKEDLFSCIFSCCQ